MTILITGGAGFVGSALALGLKQEFPSSRIICVDNLKRRGSELNLQRLHSFEVEFVHGDVRNPEDLQNLPECDWIIDASAEPSVLAGLGGTPDQVININLFGTIHLLNLAVRWGSRFIFLSSSRVYSIGQLQQIPLIEKETRFELDLSRTMTGLSGSGINEKFEVMASRSVYGATKLAAEILLHEYGTFYGVPYVINRCGVLAGPGQFGKVDQGFMTLWVASHYFKKPLAYFGFGGQGKQVRDVLHIDDLRALILQQMQDFDAVKGETFNVGGGQNSNISLNELTTLCERVTGNRVSITSVPDNRVADIGWYVGDSGKLNSYMPWEGLKDPNQTILDIYNWIQSDELLLKPILS